MMPEVDLTILIVFGVVHGKIVRRLAKGLVVDFYMQPLTTDLIPSLRLPICGGEICGSLHRGAQTNLILQYSCFDKKDFALSWCKKWPWPSTCLNSILLLLSRLYDRAVELNSRDGKTRLAFVRATEWESSNASHSHDTVDLIERRGL